MAISAVSVTVDLEPTLLAEWTDSSGSTVLIQNLGAVDIYVGGEDVDVANGVKVEAGASLSWPVESPESLYAVTGTLTSDVRVMSGGAQ